MTLGLVKFNEARFYRRRRQCQSVDDALDEATHQRWWVDGLGPFGWRTVSCLNEGTCMVATRTCSSTWFDMSHISSNNLVDIQDSLLKPPTCNHPTIGWVGNPRIPNWLMGWSNFWPFWTCGAKQRGTWTCIEAWEFQGGPTTTCQPFFSQGISRPYSWDYETQDHFFRELIYLQFVPSLEAVVPAISEDEWNVIKAVTSVCFGDGPWYRCGIPCRVVESYGVILENIVLYIHVHVYIYIFR